MCVCVCVCVCVIFLFIFCMLFIYMYISSIWRNKSCNQLSAHCSYSTYTTHGYSYLQNTSVLKFTQLRSPPPIRSYLNTRDRIEYLSCCHDDTHESSGFFTSEINLFIDVMILKWNETKTRVMKKTTLSVCAMCINRVLFILSGTMY